MARKGEQVEKPKMWGHHALAEDLAVHLRSTSDRMVWTDMQIGPSGSPRPDVYTIPKSYSKFRPMAYEIKVSVADFRRDVTVGKWQSYLKFASGVIFAVPSGLITKSDVPPGCGLIVRGPSDAPGSAWSNIKGPTLSVTESLPLDAWMKLIIDGLNRQHNELRRTGGARWAVEREIERKYGHKARELFSSVENLERRLFEKKTELEAALKKTTADVEEAHKRAWDQQRRRDEDERKYLAAEKKEICDAFGVEVKDFYKISGIVRDLSQKTAADSELQRAVSALAQCQRQISDALKQTADARLKKLEAAGDTGGIEVAKRQLHLALAEDAYA